MVDWLLRTIGKLILALRYRIRVRGLAPIAARGRGGIVLLPNHPALLDPIILMLYLQRDFHPRALADKDQIDRPIIRWLARRFGVRPLPDMTRYGPQARVQVEATVSECIAGVRQGECLLVYPSGHLYRTKLEDLRGNSAAESLLQQAPDARVVLVRTRGLWGSSFSMISGQPPDLRRVIRHGIRSVLASLLFFTPRREVTIELHEPDDLPRGADRNELNAYLERFYNQDAPPGLYVPYTIWERGGRRELPDPERSHGSEATAQVPAGARQLVLDYLKQLTGMESFRDEDRLAQDLNMDSLSRAELVIWLGKEFGSHVADVSSLNTVADVLLATRGEATGSREVQLKPAPPGWLVERGEAVLALPDGATIPDVFLAQAQRRAGQVVIADQRSGGKTYRDLVVAVLALKPLIEQLAGERLGIMLPASVAADTVYLAALFAGKVPVFVNWTTGPRNIRHSLDMLGVQHVLTAAPLVAQIESQGGDLGEVRSRFVYLEELGQRITRGAKLRALVRGWTSWRSLRRANYPETAAILLTSGSEALPKAVPLTHANLLNNIRDVLAIVALRESDRMLGFLPPFHSFGLTVTMVAPLVLGLRAVYHSNPTEAWVLAPLIEAYRATLLLGTPTFLAGIVRASRAGQLASLRIAVTGAEKCPERTFEALAAAAPQAIILEGYGITECSPIVAANRPDRLRHGTIGLMLPSYEHVIVDVESGRPVQRGTAGLLLVRGPSVFPGYIGDGVASPFVEHAGKTWYRTGDLVSEDPDGMLVFRGRLKRFVKLGGEMISLPAIEAALEKQYAGEVDEGPVLAVEAGGDENHAELVLFTTRDIDRNAANRCIRDAGLSALHNITRVMRMDELPLLGTGKTNYRALRERLTQPPAA